MSENLKFKQGQLVIAGRHVRMFGASDWIETPATYEYQSKAGNHWVTLDDGRLVSSRKVTPHPSTLTPYADYPCGVDQYRADVETLQAAGMLAGKATAGEWRVMGSGKDVYAFASGGDIIAQIGKDTYPKTRSAYMEYSNETDLVLMVNAAEVARALARFMPYVLAKLGGVK